MELRSHRKDEAAEKQAWTLAFYFEPSFSSCSYQCFLDINSRKMPKRVRDSFGSRVSAVSCGLRADRILLLTSPSFFMVVRHRAFGATVNHSCSRGRLLQRWVSRMTWMVETRNNLIFLVRFKLQVVSLSRWFVMITHLFWNVTVTSRDLALPSQKISIVPLFFWQLNLAWSSLANHSCQCLVSYRMSFHEE